MNNLDQYRATYIRLLDASIHAATLALAMLAASALYALILQGRMPMWAWVGLASANLLTIGRAVSTDTALRMHMTFGPITR